MPRPCHAVYLCCMDNRKEKSEQTFNSKQFYKELGRLLYAIASSDDRVRAQEREAMHKIVLKELSHIEHHYDSSGMNHAFYTGFTFEELEKEHTPAFSAFNSFISFFRENRAFIDARMKQAIVDAVVRVADAYRHVNRRESKLVEAVKREVGEVSV